MGLELDRKAFYNLQRKESEGQISSQEEALLILSYLEGENFHVEINEEYVLGPGGERVKRVVKDIPQATSACESSSSDKSGEEFPEVAELCSQALLQKATSIAAGRPKRNRIPSAKQASQDCRAVEARRAKEERLKNKSRKKETTQLDDFELPFRSP
jgi:hypothetical protein